MGHFQTKKWVEFITVNSKKFIKKNYPNNQVEIVILWGNSELKYVGPFLAYTNGNNDKHIDQIYSFFLFCDINAHPSDTKEFPFYKIWPPSNPTLGEG